MIKYVGKVCPFCKEAFLGKDSIVICSSCEMPHHKECWIANEGCTTFACQGTIQSPDILIESVVTDDIVIDDFTVCEECFCQFCGTKIPAVSIFCPYCGRKIVGGYHDG